MSVDRATRTRIDLLTLRQVRESGGLYEVDRKINSPDQAADIVIRVTRIHEDAQESFGIINLDTKNRINGMHVLSKGSLNASVVHPREVFKAALLNNSASIVCFHNHPSGDPTPSPEDLILTRRLTEAGQLMGIEVLDHIIIGTSSRFMSLKERHGELFAH